MRDYQRELWRTNNLVVIQNNIGNGHGNQVCVDDVASFSNINYY